MKFCCHLALQFAIALTFGEISCSSGAAESATTVKQESFERDPQWDAYNNHVAPKRIPKVAQEFGRALPGAAAGPAIGDAAPIESRPAIAVLT